MTLTDQPLPLDPVDERLIDDSQRFGDLAQLRREVLGLRVIADAARYSHGLEECIEGDCDCEEQPAADGSCCNVETRYATATDAVVRERLEHTLNEVLDLLGADTPADWVAVREQISTGVLWAADALDDADPRGDQPRPDLYRRVINDEHIEVQAIAANPPPAEGI